MYKQGITFITLVSFSFQLLGCYSMKTLEMNEEYLDEIKDGEIKTVICRDSEVYEFEVNEQYSKPYFVDSTLIGWMKLNDANDSSYTTEIRISLSDIKTIHYEKNNTILVIGLCAGAVGIGLIAYGISYIIKHSKVDFPMGGNPLGGVKF